jgi:hypothetical protein
VTTHTSTTAPQPSTDALDERHPYELVCLNRGRILRTELLTAAEAERRNTQRAKSGLMTRYVLSRWN